MAKRTMRRDGDDSFELALVCCCSLVIDQWRWVVNEERFGVVLTPKIQRMAGDGDGDVDEGVRVGSYRFDG